MEFSVPALIGIALVTMFFGYFFGLLEGRGQGYKRARNEEAPQRSEPSTLPPTREAAAKTEHDRGLLVLGLDPGGRPQLHIDGSEVDVLHVSTEQRRRLIDLMVLLKPWIEPTNAAASASQGSSAFARASGTVADDRAVLKARGGKPTPAPATPSVSPAAPAPQLSLVAQIDSILQGRLDGTPLAEKEIRLAESLHGGAIVFVGSNQYDGVDKVPDQEVQAAIRAAIAEWEKKYTPG